MDERNNDIWLEKTSQIYNIQKLREAKIAIVGLGGVGGWACETLARSGVGSLFLFDGDVVTPTNINRQLVALHSTIYQKKVDIAKVRALDIGCKFVETFPLFLRANDGTKNVPLKENEIALNDVTGILKNCDYIIDAIDSIDDKIALITLAKKMCIPIISSMGAARRKNPLLLKIDYIENTNTCPLAKIVRQRLKNLGISGVECVFSTEKPLSSGSSCAVVAAFGVALSSVVINKLGCL